MRYLFLFFIPFLGFSQPFNVIDDNGQKQGKWIKNYENGLKRYTGQFKNDIPYGLFHYYYESGELRIEKKYFHQGQAAATHFFYKNGTLKSAGIYVNELKDSTWNYYDQDSILIMTEQYKQGKLNGQTKLL